MANTGYKYAGTVEDDASVGTVSWTSPTSAQGADDTTTATATYAAPGASMTDSSVKLVVGGTISGDEKANSSEWDTVSLTWVDYGGAIDKWGLTPSVSDIKSSTFGVVISGKASGGTPISHYLKATNFDFSSIPDTATISGISVGIKKKAIFTPNCFLAGTKISTPYGPVNIEEMRVGDLVYTVDEKGVFSVTKVVVIHKTYKHKTILLKTKNHSVTTTGNHFFYTEKGWFTVDQLNVGDVIFVNIDNKTIKSEVITQIIFNKETKNPATYDLEVEDIHSFFANGFLVHNTLGGTETSYVDAFRINVFYTTGTEKIIADSLGAIVDSGGRRVVRSSANELYSVTNQSGVIRVYKSTDGSSWSEQDNAHAPVSKTNAAVAVDIDSDDVLHIVYLSSDPLLKYVSMTSGTYGTPETVWASTLRSNVAGPLAIMVDGFNVPHVAFAGQLTDLTIVADYFNRVGGSWNAGVGILPTGNSVVSIDMLFDTVNIPIVITLATDGIARGLYGNANNTTSFTTQQLSTGVLNTTGGIISGTIDASGNVWVTYVLSASGYVYLIEHPADAPWNTWNTAITDSKVGYYPTVSVNYNTVLLLYHSATASGNILLEKYDGSWSGETTLVTGVYRPTISKGTSYPCFRNPGTAANVVGDRSGSATWTNPDNAKLIDSNYTTVAQTSQYLDLTNFNFGIPTGSTIKGIITEIQRKQSGTGSSIRDDVFRLIKADGSYASTNNANAQQWQVTENIIPYGSITELWGESWSATDINDVDFGTNFAIYINNQPPCLHPDTLVLTSNGYKKISDIVTDDMVASYNEKQSTVEHKKVISSWSTPIEKVGNKYYEIVYGGKKVMVTQDHKFYIQGTYVEAKYLKTGDLLLLENLTTVPIESIAIIDNVNDSVWELSVQDNFNFFANGVLVHNAYTASINNIHVRVVFSALRNDYLFDDNSTVYWNSILSAITTDIYTKTSMRTTYYNGCTYDWKLVGSGGKNRGFQS